MARERKCTRCRGADGVPTGMVLGGECFLCHGNGAYTRGTVDPETKVAGRRRADAINILRAAIKDLPLRDRLAVSAAREHLEEHAPDRHLRLVESLLAGRVAEIVPCLRVYAQSL